MKAMIGKNVYIKVRWKGNEVMEDMVKWSEKKIKRLQLPCASADTSGEPSGFSWIRDVDMIWSPKGQSGN